MLPLEILLVIKLHIMIFSMLRVTRTIKYLLLAMLSLLSDKSGNTYFVKAVANMITIAAGC